MFNFIKRLRDYKARRDNDDMTIRNWKVKNNDIYADFTRRIDAIANGDMSVLEQMFQLAKDCVPQEALNLYGWLANLDNPSSSESQLQWAGRYTDVIARCLTHKQLWLVVNLKTSEVSVSDRKKPDCLAVCANTPVQLWKSLPLDVRTFIVEQTDRLIEDSCFCAGFDKEEIYQSIAFFSQLLFLSHAAFIGEFLANLYNKVMCENDSLAFCMYYFVVFDHGLTRMTRLLDDIIRNECVGLSGMMLVCNCIRMLVGKSIDMGIETKSTWEDTSEQCCQEVWKDISCVLHNVRTKRKNKKAIVAIDEIIIGNKKKIKHGIKTFLNDNKNDICLAYLLKSLINSEIIKPSVKYMTFHRAIEQFIGRTYGHDVPQKRYGEIKSMNLSGPQRGTSYQKAKRIIDQWTMYFENCG